MEEELAEHLGYDKHDPVGRNGQNSRNGARPKTVLTDIGPVELDVPRDRDGSFEPRIVEKRQRRLDGVDQIVLSLTARGLTTEEVAAHFADVYDATVSKDTTSRITDKVTELKNRGVEDVLIAVRDGLKRLTYAIGTTWELAQVQTCIIHLIRNTFR